MKTEKDELLIKLS